MMNQIDLRKPVYQTIQEHPEVLEILVELGFTPLKNPMMLNTVGRITSLVDGVKRIQLPIETLIETLEWNGYSVVGGK